MTFQPQYADEPLPFKSLRSRNDIVIKPADKGGAVVVWRADLYRESFLRNLSVYTGDFCGDFSHSDAYD